MAGRGWRRSLARQYWWCRGTSRMAQARPYAIETATGKVASPNTNPLAQTRQRRALSKRTADAGGSSKRQSADAAPRCGCRPRGAAGRAVATMIASPRKRDRLTVDQRVIAIDGQRSSASAARRDRNATERDRAAPTTGSDRFYSLARVPRAIAKARRRTRPPVPAPRDRLATNQIVRGAAIVAIPWSPTGLPTRRAS